MKVAVKKVDALKRQLKFEVPKERVSQKFDEVYKELGREVRVKGFRQGKVPRHILEQRHGKFAQEEVIKKLIPEVYQEGIVEQNLSPMDLPEITDVNFKDGVVLFTAHVDIRPEVKLKNYKGIKVRRKESKVTDEEVQKTLEAIKKGQEKEKKDVKLDDSFAHGLGFPNLEDFKNFLKRQMEMDKDRHNRMDVENQVVDYLIKQTPLPLPASVVERQLEHRFKDTQQRLQAQGMPEKDLKEKETEMRAELKKIVERDIKAYLIFEEIAKKENITVDGNSNLPHKVLEFLLREAKWEEKS